MDDLRRGHKRMVRIRGRAPGVGRGDLATARTPGRRRRPPAPQLHEPDHRPPLAVVVAVYMLQNTLITALVLLGVIHFVGVYYYYNTPRSRRRICTGIGSERRLLLLVGRGWVWVGFLYACVVVSHSMQLVL
uniref:Uncharacterized protein n=1 Tax=Ananas comosus var. bracteatus TaxID=296719 RepID=A0A6V7PJL3_ANACO|nr:unnamed protein product [Ananas comosus var. bracteatus]